MRLLIFFLLLSACAEKYIRLPLPASGQTKGLKTPKLLLPDPPGIGMEEAATVFNIYANSDEFYAFAKKHIHDLDGGNETNVDHAITKFRNCLATMEPVKIIWYRYHGVSEKRVLGGWRTDHLAQNPFVDMDVIKRSGHWIHELSHACGFTHIENDIVKYPVIKKSWPYQVGYQFEKFLWIKAAEAEKLP